MLIVSDINGDSKHRIIGFTIILIFVTFKQSFTVRMNMRDEGPHDVACRITGITEHLVYKAFVVIVK